MPSLLLLRTSFVDRLRYIGGETTQGCEHQEVGILGNILVLFPMLACHSMWKVNLKVWKI